jgi:argininosuccinate synthase
VLAAHKDLEKLVSTIHQNNFKSTLETQWAYLCYAGLWHEPLRSDLDAYMLAANRYVSGEVTMKLYKGSATPVARSSPFALYDQSLAGFGESGGEFSQQASPGFIELFSLQSRLAHRVRTAAEEDR